MVSSYPDSLRTSPGVFSSFQKTFEDFEDSYKLAGNSFELPGLGESGEDCMSLRARAFAKDGEAVRYEYMKCKRVECPKCWSDWAKRRVFDIVLRIEAYARANNERPYFAVASVPPSEAKGWNWNRLNESLFRRGYRRLANIGINGGYALFHPFRLTERAKKELEADGWGSGDTDAGYWKGVREDALNWGYWRKYVKFSPHLHTVVFGEPEKHKGGDYIIRFKDSSGKPEPMSLDRLIGYLFYIVTHVGVCGEFQTRVTRSFGDIYNLDPKEVLNEDEFNELARVIAEKIGMVWDAENGELTYGDDSNSDYDWVSVWRLKEYLNGENYKEWREGISEAYKEFLDILWSRCWVLRNPPPLEDMLEDHEFYDIDFVCEDLADEDIEDLAKCD